MSVSPDAPSMRSRVRTCATDDLSDQTGGPFRPEGVARFGREWESGLGHPDRRYAMQADREDLPDFARGSRKQPRQKGGADFARGERAGERDEELGPDFARGERAGERDPATKPDFARGKRAPKEDAD